MADCADDILSTLTVNEEIDTYEDVKTALDEYFKVRRNVICGRAWFNKRTQSPGQPIDTFIQDLYKLSDSCDYGNLREDLIRDRIVVGVYSDALSDSLQAKSDLLLKKAFELSRQAEARTHNDEYVRENTAATNTNVDYVKPAHAINKHKAGAKPKAKNYPTADTSTTTRRNCQKKGHFHSACRGEKVLNRVNEVQQLGSVDLQYVGAKCDNKHISAEIDFPYSGDNGENCADEQISAEIDVPYTGHNGKNCADEPISAEIDVPFLGYVGAKCNAEHWSAEIEVNGHETKFKLDTDAGVSVVSDRENWFQSENLLTTKQTLRGPGGTLLPVMGVIKARLRHRNKSLDELVYVIRNQEYSLLSRRACVGLDLVARVDNPRKHE